MDFNQLLNKIDGGEISPYQIYNLDVDYPQVFSSQHYLKNSEDTIDKNQKLHKLFLDIEVISDNQFDFDTIENGKFPISSFTLYSTYENVFHSFFLLTQKCVENWNNQTDHAEYFKKQLTDLEYLQESEIKINIKTYTSDMLLLKEAWAKIHELDPVVISGFNCVKEGETVWCENKIIKIEDSKIDLDVKKFGKIVDFKNSGKQDIYCIKTKSGHELNVTENHKTPIFKKDLDKYVNSKTLIKNYSIETTSNLINMLNNKDMYLILNKNENTNKCLTYNDYISNNIDMLLEYDFFDVVLNEKNRQTYKNVKCEKEKLLNILKNENYKIKIRNRFLNINKDDTIDNDVLYVLGLIFTDGFHSKYDKSFSICSKYKELLENVLNIYDNKIKIKENKRIGENRIRKHPRTDFDIYHIRFGISNVLSILYPMIYHKTLQKNININLLSQLSYKQFMYFFSGLIDGDGCVRSDSIELCNFDNKIENNLKNINELLLWNGIYATLNNKNHYIHISANQFSEKFINGLILTHPDRKTKINKIKFRTVCDSKAKNISIREVDGLVFTKIEKIEKIECQYETYDISTTKKFFISNGTTTHNSDGFDLPYIFYRLKALYNGDLKSVSKIMSKFGDVSINKWGGNRGTVRLNEFINADLAYLYRPRDDNGLNLGKKLASYSLDFVSDFVLEKKKLDYKSNNLTLDQFYEKDPVNYLLYNIIDVCLCVLLDRKLKHIDQYNMYRRLMNTSFGESLRGSTALFDTLVLYKLTERNECVRYGLNDETTITINKTEIDEIPKPLASKDIKWTINNIDQQTYLKITRKFEGAY